MSEANRVRVTYAQARPGNYGEIPPISEEWQIARMVSETLSATPTTQVSNELRDDRMTSDQIKVGLESTGQLNLEFSAQTYDDFILAAMCDTGWTPTGRTNLSQTDNSTTYVAATGAIVGSAVDWAAQGYTPGMMVTVSGFVNSANNGSFRLKSIDKAVATTFYVINPDGVDEPAPTAVTIDWTAPQSEDEVVIGLTDRDFAIEVSYEDINKYLMFQGQRVGELNLSYQYGAILTGAITFRGSAAQPADASAIPVGATINPATTTTPMNASSDVPFTVIDGEVSSDIIIQSIDFNISNNLRDVTGIGFDAPVDINKGRALVTGNLNAYLSGASWRLYSAGVLQQTPMSISVYVTDGTYAYAFDFPRIKLSGQAPQPTGIDTDVMITSEFTALLDPALNNMVRIRRATL